MYFDNKMCQNLNICTSGKAMKLDYSAIAKTTCPSPPFPGPDKMLRIKFYWNSEKEKQKDGVADVNIVSASLAFGSEKMGWEPDQQSCFLSWR